jgi:hypothetical protein
MKRSLLLLLQNTLTTHGRTRPARPFDCATTHSDAPVCTACLVLNVSSLSLLILCASRICWRRICACILREPVPANSRASGAWLGLYRRTNSYTHAYIPSISIEPFLDGLP